MTDRKLKLEKKQWRSDTFDWFLFQILSQLVESGLTTRFNRTRPGGVHVLTEETLADSNSRGLLALFEQAARHVTVLFVDHVNQRQLQKEEYRLTCVLLIFSDI